MSRSLTLGDVGRIAVKLARPDGTRWGVRLDSRTAVHRFFTGRQFTYTTATVWREVEDDYEDKAEVKLGALLYEEESSFLKREPRGLHIVLVEGLEQVVLAWFIPFAKERHVPVYPPPSAQTVMDLLAAPVDSAPKKPKPRRSII